MDTGQLQVLGGSKDDAALDSMDPGEDFLMDALFGNHDGSHHGQGGCGTATVALQFPVPREVYKSMTNADFIQPGLVQLQPSLDDFFMDLDQQPDWILSRYVCHILLTVDGKHAMDVPKVNKLLTFLFAVK